MTQLTGRAFIAVAGKQMPSKEGAKLGYPNPERKAVMGERGVLGYTETPTTPYIEATIQHDADLSIDELANGKDVTVSFRTDTGVSFVLRNAWLAKPIEMTKGEITVRYEGMSMEEVR